MEQFNEQGQINNSETGSFERLEEERQTYIREVENKIREAEKNLDEGEAGRFRLVKEILDSFTAEEIDQALEKINRIRESQDIS